MSHFGSPLQATLLHDDNGARRASWRLDAEFIFYSDIIGKVLVPAGEISDFASVPRRTLTWLIAGGVGNQAAVIHDHLYRFRIAPRETCDAVFREALLVDGVARWRASLMYAAVRLFGWRSYRRAHRRRID